MRSAAPVEVDLKAANFVTGSLTVQMEKTKPVVEVLAALSLKLAFIFLRFFYRL